jgi:hypothetical protein
MYAIISSVVFNFYIITEIRDMKNYDVYAVVQLSNCIDTAWPDLYQLSVIPTLQNLAKHLASGNWNENAAIRSMRRLADKGAKRYAREFGKSDEKWQRMFTAVDRTETARQLLSMYRDHISELAGLKKAA